MEIQYSKLLGYPLLLDRGMYSSGCIADGDRLFIGTSFVL